MRTEIHIFSGLGGWFFSRGTRVLESLIDELPYEADAQHHRHQSWEKVSDGIIARAARWGPADVNILIGHSYGALRCQQIHDRLLFSGIHTDYIAGIDPTALPHGHPSMVIARSPGLHVSEFHASRGWPARARRRDITGKRGGKYIYQNGVEHNIIDIGGGHVACASNSRTRAIIIRRVRGLLKLTHEDPPPKPETDVWPFVIPETERNIHEIIWHCAATPEGRSIGENPAETIDRWHKERGWAGIGYHAVVDLDGKIYLGRDWNKIGAHVKGHNTGSLGFCYVGGVAKDGKTVKDTRTDAQRAAMLELTKMTIDKYPNIGRIAGHREYAPRGCPSFEMPEDKLGNIPGFLKGRKQ